MPGNMVQCILDVESVYEDGVRGRIPNWVRLQSVTMTVNTLDWPMDMVGFQQTSEVDHIMRGNKDDF